MKAPILDRPRVSARARVAALAASVLFAATAAAQSDIDSIWNDPVFKRQFVAGYGINAEVEPRLTPEEVAILEKIRPLMADALPQAEAALKAAMLPGCSAILDFTLAGTQVQQNKLDEAHAGYQKAVAAAKKVLYLE